MKIKFDLSRAQENYSRALTGIAGLPGLEPKKIVLAEAGTILKACAARTKVAPVSKITAGARLRVLRSLQLTKGDITINAGVKAPYGRVWSRGASGKWDMVLADNFTNSNRHVSDSRWNAISNKVQDVKTIVAKVIPQAKLAAGLARKSWIQIADKLGIHLEDVPGSTISSGAISKARASKARGGKDSANGQAKQETEATSYFVTLINRLPYGRKIGLDRTLATVITGRANFFATAVKKGYTGSLQQTAKLFPSWVVK